MSLYGVTWDQLLAKDQMPIPFCASDWCTAYMPQNMSHMKIACPSRMARILNST